MWDLKEKIQHRPVCNFKAVHRRVSAVFSLWALVACRGREPSLRTHKHAPLIFSNYSVADTVLRRIRQQAFAVDFSKKTKKKSKNGGAAWFKEKKKRQNTTQKQTGFSRFSLHPTHVLSQEQIPRFPAKQRARGEETRLINDVIGTMMQRHRHACGLNPTLVGSAVRAMKMHPLNVKHLLSVPSTPVPQLSSRRKWLSMWTCCVDTRVKRFNLRLKYNSTSVSHLYCVCTVCALLKLWKTVTV